MDAFKPCSFLLKCCLTNGCVCLAGLFTTQTSCVVMSVRHFQLPFNLLFPRSSLVFLGFLLDSLFCLDFRDIFSNLEKDKVLVQIKIKYEQRVCIFS